MTREQKRRYMAAWRRAHRKQVQFGYVVEHDRKKGYAGSFGIVVGIAWQRIVGKVLG